MPARTRKGRVFDPAKNSRVGDPSALPKAGVQAKPKRQNCLLSNLRELWSGLPSSSAFRGRGRERVWATLSAGSKTRPFRSCLI